MSERTLLMRVLVAYAVFVAASWIEYLSGGELLFFLWPHLAGLAVGLTSGTAVVMLQAIGLLLVTASALVVSARWPLLRSWRLAAGLVITVLGVATAAPWGLALALGWPIVV